MLNVIALWFNKFFVVVVSFLLYSYHEGFIQTVARVFVLQKRSGHASLLIQ